MGAYHNSELTISFSQDDGSQEFPTTPRVVANSK